MTIFLSWFFGASFLHLVWAYGLCVGYGFLVISCGSLDFYLVHIGYMFRFMSWSCLLI